MDDPSIISNNPQTRIPSTSTPNTTANRPQRRSLEDPIDDQQTLQTSPPETANRQSHRSSAEIPTEERSAGPQATRNLADGSSRDRPPHAPATDCGGRTVDNREHRRVTSAEDRAARVQQAEFDRLAASLISSVNNHINDEDLLKADGSNFAAWEDFIEERMRGATGAVSFFNRPARNILHEQVGRALIINAVDRSLRRGISRLTSAHEMFNDLNLRFRSVSRAAQVSLYRQLISFNATDHPSTAQMASHIGDLLDEMTSAGILFTREHLARLVLQNGLQGDPTLQEEFNRRVELDFQTSTAERPAMTFEDMIRLIDIIRRQQRFQSTTNEGTRTTPLVMQAEPQIAPAQDQHQAAGMPMYPDHPDNLPDAHDFMAMQAGLCWQCRSPDHLLRNCPLRSRPGAPRGRFRSQAPQATPYSARPGQGFESFYPIVTPPGFSAVYPQTHSNHRPAHGPLNSQQAPQQSNQNRPADYYRPPQYRLQRVNPQSESIGSQRPKPSANETTAGSDSNNESCARMVELGDVAEDLANIHFDHVQVDSPDNAPIVDSVATSGNPAFITGEGDLTFSGLDNQRVTIHGVLY
ncbi:hypothetical protein PGT21_050278 [Puccinia graminis f. sp. tritici]|uniref:CCHC-type domain-containing protein n=1 Tax=Puccinia graminis f. sp. tritici TaxID=56615 RepID=A0A5B0QZP8_PUCGR|nr:hypothetical protein PGT21_050278 [Puccinia graminis f. sp. tritici]